MQELYKLRESWKLLLKSVRKWLKLCKLLISSTINIQTQRTRIFLFGYQNHIRRQQAPWHNTGEALFVFLCIRSTHLLLVEISACICSGVSGKVG